MPKKTPAGLKGWFIAHSVIDLTFAIPMFFWPRKFLQFIGLTNTTDTLLVRLVAAILFAIGIESYLGRNADRKTYQQMLNLKIIWSFFAILALVFSVSENYHLNKLLILLVFIVFNTNWIYWKLRLNH